MVSGGWKGFKHCQVITMMVILKTNVYFHMVGKPGVDMIFVDFS